MCLPALHWWEEPFNIITNSASNISPKKPQEILLAIDDSEAKKCKKQDLGGCFTCSKELLDLTNYAAYQRRRSCGCHVMICPIICAWLNNVNWTWEALLLIRFLLWPVATATWGSSQEDSKRITHCSIYVLSPLMPSEPHEASYCTCSKYVMPVTSFFLQCGNQLYLHFLPSSPSCSKDYKKKILWGLVTVGGLDGPRMSFPFSSWDTA